MSKLPNTALTFADFLCKFMGRPLTKFEQKQVKRLARYCDRKVSPKRHKKEASQLTGFTVKNTIT